MVTLKYGKVRAKRPAKNLFFIHYSLFFSLALTALSACQSDWRNGITRAEQPAGITFTGSVVGSQKATRADGSLIELNEVTLPETKERTYYRADADGNVPAEGSKEIYYAGLFGCHTGQYTWAELVVAYRTAFTASGIKSSTEYLKSKAFKTFAATPKGKAYTANLFYNQPMTIKSDKTLTYEPIKFWPNNIISEGTHAGQHDLCTFWAYYPYNETGSHGSHGIAITQDSLGPAMGIGRVKFTMNPDAAMQNDFLISDPVVDCNRENYPLKATATDGQYEPTPVKLRFHHMLAQIRIYAFIRGTDKVVYATDDSKDDKIRRVTAEEAAAGKKIMNAWGVEHDAVEGEPVPDDTSWLTEGEKTNKTVRWDRTGNVLGLETDENRYRANISYKLAFNNLKTASTFYPVYSAGSATIGHSEAGSLGSVTVNHYIMNPYWFTFDPTTKERVMVNDHYMYGDFEDTPGYKGEDATDTDGYDWSTKGANYLDYILNKENQHPDNAAKHYNYAPGNIILAVPQELSDDDVPHIVITATGKDSKGNDVSAKVTINMLKMGLHWESGYIYCYAFLDELRPGDDKVRGPESITTIFDPKQWTDQW